MYSKNSVNKILFVSLSNIGDCILTLPALDALRENFPQAKIKVLVGRRPKEIFQNNPNIDEVVIFDKHAKIKEQIKLFYKLRNEKFDLVIDLRNSLFAAFLSCRYRLNSLWPVPKAIIHMRDRHLYKIKNKVLDKQKKSLHIMPEDEKYIEDILNKQNVTDQDKIVVVSPGARSHIKRWPQDKFVELIQSLIEEFKAKIILAGDKDDAPITKYIATNTKYPVIDLSGKTDIKQLASLLKRSSIVITNDSATLHLASYLDKPVIAIFGPTDELKYGPWSCQCVTIKKDIFCRPCEKAQCKSGDLKCMQLIKVEDVLRPARNILSGTPQSLPVIRNDDYKRILLVRTDRIGDVLLSTPVIKAVRDSCPYAYIAMLVSPYAKDIIDGNPYLDEVIIYDKDTKHKTWQESIRFTCNLKKKKFDLAIILHPTNRMHLVTFFAGIPRRVGYDRKLGFLLTDRIKHSKQLGQKHELEYNLDLLTYLGISPKDKTLFMPIKPESELWVEELFKREGIKQTDKLLAMHPAASCPSKIWPETRFSQVADRLIEKNGFKVLIIAGPKDISKVENLIKHMRLKAINLAGKTSVSQLASLLKRCQLFISNDSGPVHIASAVGTPVISIFGRNQKGLSPQRWGPLGAKDKILHKEVGCIQCLAHNCVKQFACLKAISVDDVLAVADSILGSEI